LKEIEMVRRTKAQKIPFVTGDEVHVLHTEELLAEIADRLSKSIGALRSKEMRDDPDWEKDSPRLAGLVLKLAALKAVIPGEKYKVVQASSKCVVIEVNGVDVDLPIKDNKKNVKIEKV
jgi:hypothetical protein